jgi:hypothetical protein
VCCDPFVLWVKAIPVEGLLKAIVFVGPCEGKWKAPFVNLEVYVPGDYCAIRVSPGVCVAGGKINLVGGNSPGNFHGILLPYHLKVLRGKVQWGLQEKHQE